MVRTAAAMWLLLGCALAAAAPPSPLDQALADRAHDAFGGAVREGRVLTSGGRGQTWPLRVKPGACYGAVAVGGDGIRTMILKVTEGYKVLDRDVSVHAYGKVRFCTQSAAAMYTLSADVTIGSGEVRAAVYRMTPAPAVVAVAPAKSSPAPRAERPERVRESGRRERDRDRDRARADDEPRRDRVVERADHVSQAANNVASSLSMLPSVSVQTSTERQEGPAPASNSGGGGGGEAEGGCDGDFELGSTSYFDSSAHAGDECNSYRNPTNCPTGVYIHLGHPRRCVCVARCEEYGNRPAPGNACTADGSWVCEHYQSKTARAHAELCAPRDWNLCHR